METIQWGIIGCGDVTELKSGPAFNKVGHSRLVAVMRRDASKAEDYARRHNVPKWYSDADRLINDPEINAIYVATPPSSHEEYTSKALKAGKPVYVEKPMSVNAASAERMANLAEEAGQKLVVAHYRRGQILFQKIKQLIEDKHIGNTLFCRSEISKRPLSRDDLQLPKTAWRVNPELAGGGLFHDLSPHQLDLALFFFGEIEKTTGFASNQGNGYMADDMVSASVLFKNGVHFNGTWCFNVAPADERDECEIIGTKGKIIFSFFEQKPLRVVIEGKTTEYRFEALRHVQQPMIGMVVNYFRGHGANPCSAPEGVQVMKMIDRITGK